MVKYEILGELHDSGIVPNKLLLDGISLHRESALLWYVSAAYG